MYLRWITPILIVAAAGLQGADGDRTVVALHLNRNAPAWSAQTIDFGEPADAKVIAAPGAARAGKVAELAVRATPKADQAGAYLLELKNADGQVVSAEVTSAASVRVEIQRRAGRLPFRIELDPNAGPKGAPRERLSWSAEYRAEGTLVIGECRMLMAIWDMNSNGVFDRRDFNRGSAAGVDLNGDGKIFGRGEYIYGGEVFEFCGRRFFVDPDSLQPHGTAVTVVETSLEKPRLGAPVPTLWMEITDGATLRSGDWKGKVVLLDFWASWCGYCIDAFPTIKQMQETHAPNLQVIAINTDEPSEIPAARKVVASHEMPWAKVMSGKGLNDPLWMMFQGLDQGIPLYVLIDREGIVRYSGSGGEGLKDLRAGVERLVAKP